MQACNQSRCNACGWYQTIDTSSKSTKFPGLERRVFSALVESGELRMTHVACHSVRRSPSLPGVSTRKTFETRLHPISTLLGKSLVQDRHLLPATVIAWQIKLRVTLHLSAVTQRIQMDRWYFSDHIKVKVN